MSKTQEWENAGLDLAFSEAADLSFFHHFAELLLALTADILSTPQGPEGPPQPSHFAHIV
jgi:hypothetical protein